MVGSFRHKGLKRMYEGDAKGVEASLRTRVKQILALLDRASSPQALALPGLNLHELQGRQRGVWSVWVNKNWRITFRFEAGRAEDIDLVDYH